MHHVGIQGDSSHLVASYLGSSPQKNGEERLRSLGTRIGILVNEKIYSTYTHAYSVLLGRRFLT